MEKISRKKRKEHPRLRRALPLVLLALAALTLAAGGLLNRTARVAEVTPREMTHGLLAEKPQEAVRRIEVQLRDGGRWAAEQTSPGVLTEDSGFELSPYYSAVFLQAAAAVGYEDCFTRDAADYEGRLAEFGLDSPAAAVTVRYADGDAITFRIGDRSQAEDTAYCYLTADGVDGLYGMAVSTADDWKTPPEALVPFEQLALQSSRLDSIRITDTASGEVRAWQMEGKLTDANASDTWRVTSPFGYPADGTAMIDFLHAIGSLRLGRWYGEDTPGNREALGLGEVQTELVFHMAEGTGTVTGEDGAVSTRVFPEETVVLQIYGITREGVYAAGWRGGLYLVSALTLSPVAEKRPEDTVSPYPVLVSAEELSLLRIEHPLSGEETVYAIYRGEDGEGGEVLACTENGVEVPYDTFAARYSEMALCTVSGRTPEGYVPQNPVHTRYTYQSIYGRVHTLELSDFDGLHDAVRVDGSTVLFYLIKGALGM